MNEWLEKIQTANDVLNHNNPAWKEEIDKLVKCVLELEEHREELRESYRVRCNKYVDLYAENQHYKQALEKIKESVMHSSNRPNLEVLYEVYENVREALEYKNG